MPDTLTDIPLDQIDNRKLPLRERLNDTRIEHLMRHQPAKSTAVFKETVQ